MEDVKIDREFIESQIIEAREFLANYFEIIRELEENTKPPVVQELVLARRAGEDARMRLGVALALLNDKNPWRS